jgi:formamidopyrimidine-DNA glycosylase
MPELAEVEYYRRQWDAGLGQRVMRVHMHATTRVFRGTDAKRLVRAVRGLRYRESWARGKQMLFRFGESAWIGIHLGMTGKLRAESLPFRPSKHDHLVITLEKLALVFVDPRQFGRVQFHEGPTAAEWWVKIPSAPIDRAFSERLVRDFLARHRKLPIKATLLLQAGFPGIGNWMADEVLWQSGIAPLRKTGKLSADEVRALWKATRAISRTAMKTIAKNFADPPAGWLFHQRWSCKGLCPRHRSPLRCATVGGRTTVWCSKCQPIRRKSQIV